jgi:hypothetical protein
MMYSARRSKLTPEQLVLQKKPIFYENPRIKLGFARAFERTQKLSEIPTF